MLSEDQFEMEQATGTSVAVGGFTPSLTWC